MAPVTIDPDKIREFATPQDFHDWLSKHHDTADEVWVKIHKKGSGLPSIDWKQAVEVVLCWGWIDGIRKSLDDRSFVQRFTRRSRKSIWSQINKDTLARLVAEGRMTEHGLREVEAAKADGRWERAYASGKDLAIPADLRAAIDANPDAARMFETLSAQNRFALAFRMHNTKTEAGRRKKIAAFVEMLARGETIHPQRPKR
jgi:uncharacterized protein YdeI (YjbR/CyaY-like superfamily)